MVWSCWQTKGWTGGNIISLISLNPLLFKKIAHVGVFMQFVFVFVWATQGIHWYIIFGTFVVFVFVFVFVILADLKLEIFLASNHIRVRGNLFIFLLYSDFAVFDVFAFLLHWALSGFLSKWLGLSWKENSFFSHFSVFPNLRLPWIVIFWRK